MMRVTGNDIEWLEAFFPGLQYDFQLQQINGEMQFCAAYDRQSGKLTLGSLAGIQGSTTLVQDTFQISIRLTEIDNNGWPLVYEVSQRYQDIAERNGIAVADLHFMDAGICCLSISYAKMPRLTLESFMDELVIPFFYRLSYVDKFGIAAARTDLWEEYPHGDAGYKEYEKEMWGIALSNPGRNQPCPCGSGQKYKRCHLDEVESAKRLGLLR